MTTPQGTPVLFIGGPLDGEVHHVIDPSVPVVAEYRRGDPGQGRVGYYTHRFVMFGQTVWIGTLTAAPSQDTLFRLLASDVAQRIAR